MSLGKTGDNMKIAAKMYFLCAVSICAVLAGCAKSGNTPESSGSIAETPSGSAVTTTASTTTKYATVTEPIKTEPQFRTITAEVTDYKDSTLYFTYEGKDYALPMLSNRFCEGGGSVGMPRYEKTVSEKIIHNKFGEKVMGAITINEDMTSIKQCNVIDPNVTQFEQDYPYIDDKEGGFKVDPDRLYSFKKTTGSKCVVANKYNTYEFDLNDLRMEMKLRYDDEYPIVGFRAYKFKSGNLILSSILPNRIDEKGKLGGSSEWMKPAVERSIGYFGTMLKNENDIAEVLLNDGKTVIVVPSYFNDGDVKEGMKVMVDTWQTEEKFYGTGQRAEFKEALIWTDSYYYIYSLHNYKFEDLTYAILQSPNADERYQYITKEKFEKIHKEE